jgi:hypothetical protein
LRRLTIFGGTTFGLCLVGKARLLKQCLYALLEEHTPEGVSFQTRVSFPSVLIMGVSRIAVAVSGVNKEFIKCTFHFSSSESKDP